MSSMEEAVERETADVGVARVSYLCAGKPGGAPVVLVHGIPAGAELWRGLMPTLAESGYCVYAPDLPGYGTTRLPADGDYSLNGAAEVLAQWLEVLDIPRTWLVAHDIGGGVAQILAVRHPERVSRLTISNAIVGDSWPVRPIRMLQVMARTGLFERVMASAAVRDNPVSNWELNHAVADPSTLTPALKARVFNDAKLTTAEGRRAFARHLRQLDNRQTLAVEPRLCELTMPVQLIWGMRDKHQSWEKAGKRLLRHFPDAHVTRLEGASHFVQLDAPDDFARAMLQWAHSGAPSG